MSRFLAIACWTSLLLVAGCPRAMSEDDKDYFRALVGADPGSGGGSGGAALVDCNAPVMVFTKRDPDQRLVGCAQPACHDGATRQSGLDLSLDDPFPPLVDKPADTASLLSACQTSGLLVVDSARPDQSLLYTKMFRTDDPSQTLHFSGCGVSMPYPFGPARADAWERDCVLSWIASRLDAGSGGAGANDADAGPGEDDAGPSGGGGAGGESDDAGPAAAGSQP